MAMQQIYATVRGDGAVTIPNEVRQELGIGAPDRVTFIVEDGTVRLQRAPVSVADLFGSIPALPGRETDDFEDIIEEAMEAEADRIVAEMRDQRP